MCVVQKPTLLCSAKTNTTSSGKLGRAVSFSTRASRVDVGFYTTLQVYCKWFVSDFTLLAVSIYLFYLLFPGPGLMIPVWVGYGQDIPVILSSEAVIVWFIRQKFLINLINKTCSGNN